MLNEEQTPAADYERRRAGILLHLTSLPGAGPCGSLGPQAHRFVGLLADCGMSVWQMLPIGPTEAGGSPYQTNSAHAGNPRLIALEPLLERGWALPGDDANGEALRRYWDGFRKRASDADRQALIDFAVENDYWLDNYSLFRALHEEQQTPWWDWPPALRRRDPDALAQARLRLDEDFSYIRFEQFLFFNQWQLLRGHANAVGIELFGDMPIFVAHDSAEVWARPRDFDLNEDGSPRVVAGVPPDYFSATGQRWGNPLYRWDRMRADGFRFWVDRIRTQLRLFDMVRIDHFRGFDACWEIPAEEKTAVKGRWVAAPGDELFECLHRHFGRLPLIAEDLGVITPEVDALRKKHHLPGMRVLQFAFSEEAPNPHQPFLHDRDSVVYTGTHDNDTTLGWYRSLDTATRDQVDTYLGYPSEDMPWPLIRCALGSCAQLAILPMQDVLGLDGEHRMNLPGTSEGNWGWRFSWDQAGPELADRMLSLVKLYGR